MLYIHAHAEMCACKGKGHRQMLSIFPRISVIISVIFKYFSSGSSSKYRMSSPKYICMTAFNFIVHSTTCLYQSPKTYSGN